MVHTWSQIAMHPTIGTLYYQRQITGPQGLLDAYSMLIEQRDFGLLQCLYRVIKCASACTHLKVFYIKFPFISCTIYSSFNKKTWTFNATTNVTEGVLHLQWWKKKQTRPAPCSFYFQIIVISINSSLQLMSPLLLHYTLRSLLQTVISLTSP